tara:strand:- start:12 stop:1442 length:1431 start_codon:yes stop_codon:yes gene_type:complete
MQGFINTTAGLRPLLLEGIEAVNYQQYTTASQDHGIISIKYVPNTGIGGGNIFIWVPFYTDLNYPVERFWDWVASVAQGGIGKTLNSFYNGKPFAAIQTSSLSGNFSQSEAFVFRLEDTATIDDACNHQFETADLSASGVNTFINVVTNNSQNSDPNVGDKIYISTNQGYTGASNPFEKASITAPSPNNAELLDGVYAYLSGTPAYNQVDPFKGSVIPQAQTGSVFKIEIKSGFIIESLVCPVNFTGLGDVSDIPGYIFAVTDPFLFNNNLQSLLCFDQVLQNNPGVDPSTVPLNGGKWLAVEFGFKLLPNSAPMDPATPPGVYVCNYTGGVGGFSSAFNIPNFAEVYMKDPSVGTDGLYKRLEDGNTWTIPSAIGPPVPETWNYNQFGQGIFPGAEGVPIVVPSQAYYGQPTDPDYAFDIDWGPGYPDEKGNNLVCEYFKTLTGVFNPTTITPANAGIEKGATATVFFQCGGAGG